MSVLNFGTNSCHWNVLHWAFNCPAVEIKRKPHRPPNETEDNVTAMKYLVPSLLVDRSVFNIKSNMLQELNTIIKSCRSEHTQTETLIKPLGSGNTIITEDTNGAGWVGGAWQGRGRGYGGLVQWEPLYCRSSAIKRKILFYPPPKKNKTDACTFCFYLQPPRPPIPAPSTSTSTSWNISHKLNKTTRTKNKIKIPFSAHWPQKTVKFPNLVVMWSDCCPPAPPFGFRRKKNSEMNEWKTQGTSVRETWGGGGCWGGYLALSAIAWNTQHLPLCWNLFLLLFFSLVYLW